MNWPLVVVLLVAVVNAVFALIATRAANRAEAAVRAMAGRVRPTIPSECPWKRPGEPDLHITWQRQSLPLPEL